MNLTLWMPPKPESIYAKPRYLYCNKCSKTIENGTLMKVDDQDLERLDKGESPYNAQCMSCSINAILLGPEVREFIHEVVREELKKIIKEEVHDPDGAFSPDGHH